MTPLAVVVAAAWVIAGEQTCPSADEIARALEAIAPHREGLPPATVRIARTADHLRLDLVGGEAGEGVSRELDATGSCSELATAAAVVIATWQGDLSPGTSPEVTLPAPARPAPPQVAVPRAAPPSEPPLMFSLGAGLLASTTGGAVAPGFELRGALGLRGSRFAGGAALGATTARSAAVGTMPGAARWTRGWLALGPELRLGGGHDTFFTSRAGVLVGLLHVEGSGLPTTSSDSSFQVGAGAGAGVATLAGGTLLWLDVRAHVWPGHERLLIAGGYPGEGRLPRLELLATAGASLGHFR
jgi:hypothetical protein